jgi:hypothetical protein
MTIASLFAACGGSGRSGAPCEGHQDCNDGFQCALNVCIPLCNRAQECGDGFQCTSSGYCLESRSKSGAVCNTETACAAGLSCVLDDVDVDGDGLMQASCAASHQGHIAGEICSNDSECRNSTCAVGRCIDVCQSDRDCSVGQMCTQIPRVEAGGSQFSGCLQESGTISYPLPGEGSVQRALIAVPKNAQSFSLIMQIDDDSQRVGLFSLTSPSGNMLFSEWSTSEQFYANLVRHSPQRIQSVAQVPSSVDTPFEYGAYTADIRSFRTIGQAGTATPRATVVVKLGSGNTLDLHLRFADLQEHACRNAFESGQLNASAARSSLVFQEQFVQSLRSILGRAGVSLGNVTYEDIVGRPELDAVNADGARALFLQNSEATGISLFFVRSLAPAGVAVIGESPGPAGIAPNASAGIAISTEALCYRSWSQVARTAAHQIAGYMGLYANIDLSNGQDPIGDSDDSSDNLMFYSELGGSEVSDGQAQVLRRSPVLR